MCDYEKEYKISLQGIWKYLERKKNPRSRRGRLNGVTPSVFFIVISSNAIQITTSTGLFVELDRLILKFM